MDQALSFIGGYSEEAVEVIGRMIENTFNEIPDRESTHLPPGVYAQLKHKTARTIVLDRIIRTKGKGVIVNGVMYGP